MYVIYGNNLITRRSYICSNLCTQKPLETCAFLVCPLAPCQTCVASHARLDPIRPTCPTYRLARSLGRTPQPGIPRKVFSLLRTGAVLHSQESKCQGQNLYKLRNTSTNQEQCRSSTCQNLATLHGRNL